LKHKNKNALIYIIYMYIKALGFYLYRLILLAVCLFIASCVHTPKTLPTMQAECFLETDTFSDGIDCIETRLRSDFRYYLRGSNFVEQYLASARAVEEKLHANKLTEAEARKSLLEIYSKLKQAELVATEQKKKIELIEAEKALPKKREIRCNTDFNRNTVCREM